MADLDKAVAAKLWDAMTVGIDRFHLKLFPHPKSVFLGYADITLTIPQLEGFALKVRGVGCKILKGNAMLEFKEELGADGEYYPQVFPKTHEMRAVLTTAIFAHKDVQEAVAAAGRLPEQSDEGEASEADAANPFNS